MSALRALTLAIEVAERRRDEAEQRLTLAHRAVRSAQGQLDQLESYAADTQARWATAGARPISPAVLQHHYQFMERLGQAIVLQADAIGDLNKRVAEARELLVQEEVRLAGLNRVLETRRTARVATLERREQRELDELALMKYARKTGGVNRLSIGEES